MGRRRLTAEEKEQKKEELIAKMRKLMDMVGEVSDLTHTIGLREKVSNEILVGSLTIRPAKIIDYVQNRFDVVIGQRCRRQSVVFARQICMYLLRKYTKLSLHEIAKYTGGTDHSTVIAGLKRLNNLMETEEETKLTVLQCENDIYEHFKESIAWEK